MTSKLQPDVVVNGEVIPARLIAAEAQNHVAPSGKPGLAWRGAARALVVRALLLQEARRLGLEAACREVDASKRETPDEALIRAAIERSVRPVPPDEAVCRAHYDWNGENYRSPTLYEASHILLAVEDGSEGRVSASASARVLIDRLAERPHDFADLARSHSACSSGVNGGRLGQLSRGDTAPEFERALEELSVGEITEEPIETRYGVHIIRLDARAEGEILPFESVRPRIRETLERMAWTCAAKRLVEDLIGSAEITGVDFDRAT